jgi:hypothetical protein
VTEVNGVRIAIHAPVVQPLYVFADHLVIASQGVQLESTVVFAFSDRHGS